jgi:hypothetical protein
MKKILSISFLIISFSIFIIGANLSLKNAKANDPGGGSCTGYGAQSWCAANGGPIELGEDCTDQETCNSGFTCCGYIPPH